MCFPFTFIQRRSNAQPLFGRSLDETPLRMRKIQCFRCTRPAPSWLSSFPGSGHATPSLLTLSRFTAFLSFPAPFFHEAFPDYPTCVLCLCSAAPHHSQFRLFPDVAPAVWALGPLDRDRSQGQSLGNLPQLSLYYLYRLSQRLWETCVVGGRQDAL